MSGKILIAHPDHLTALSSETSSEGIHLELVLLQPLQDDLALSSPNKARSSIDLSSLSQAWRKRWAQMPHERIQSVSFNTHLPERFLNQDPTLCRELYCKSRAPSQKLPG
jgi:hypothetical protein